MKDKYDNFYKLAAQKNDFSIECVDRGSRLAIVAIHGGSIEVGTAEIAKQIASNRHSLYVFSAPSYEYHISSDRFFEPKLDKLLNRAETVLAIHGEKTKDDLFVIVGGLDEALKAKLSETLSNSGFKLASRPDKLRGIRQSNVCNRGTSNKGAQIEISRGLRKALADNSTLSSKFVDSLKASISS